MECQRSAKGFRLYSLGWRSLIDFSVFANTLKLHTRVCVCVCVCLCVSVHMHISWDSYNQLHYSHKVKYHCKNMKRPCRNFNYTLMPTGKIGCLLLRKITWAARPKFGREVKRLQ